MSSVTNSPRSNQGQGQGASHSSPSNVASSAAEKTKEAASGLGERVQEAASYLGEQAKSATSSVMHSAKDAATYVGKKADEGLHAAGSGLESLGDSVRRTAPQSGMAKDGMRAVADSLTNTGKYLEEEGLSGIAEDMTSMIKRNPIPALFIGVGVGFLLGRALTSRNY